MKSLTSSNIQMENNSVIRDEMSINNGSKGLRGQENNSILIKPKEIDQHSEEKSSDINYNKRLRVNYKARKRFAKFRCEESSDRVFNFTKKRNSI